VVAVQPTDLSFVVARSRAIANSVSHAEAPVTLAGILVALALVASAGSYWVDRRRYEVTLLRSRGIAPSMIAVKAVLEMAPAALVGTALGTAAAWLLVRALGPSPLIGSGAVSAAVERSAVAVVAGLVVLGAVALVRSARRRSSSPTRRRWMGRIPWELAGLAASGVALWRLSAGSAALEPSGASTAAVGPLYLAFPVLFLVSVTALGVRLGVALLPRARRATQKGGPATFLGVARLAAAPRIGATLLGASSLAVGMLVYAATVTVTEQATVNAKAETFVGSASAAYLSTSVPLPRALKGQATEVERLSPFFVGGSPVDVIGVDPATFTDAAFWTSAYGGSQVRLRSLLQQLAAAPVVKGRIPVVVTNGRLPARTEVQAPLGDSGTTTSVQIRTVATLAGFPGENGNNLLLVTDARQLAKLAPTPEIWSQTSAATLTNALGRAGIHGTIVISAASALDLTDFLAIGWSFAYLEVLGVLIGLIAVAGMLLYLETRQRSRFAAYALSRRMGLTRLAHMASIATELGVTLVGGAVLGAALGWAAAALVHGDLNPLPDLPPGTLLTTSVVTIASTLAAVLVTWAAGFYRAQRLTDRSSPAQVLRADQ
jgi:putative ABC transport system permease protein